MSVTAPVAGSIVDRTLCPKPVIPNNDPVLESAAAGDACEASAIIGTTTTRSFLSMPLPSPDGERGLGSLRPPG